MPAELADTLAPSQDDRLLQAEAIVRGYCGWHIAFSREDEVTLRPTSSPVLLLPSLHVTDVASVTVNQVDLDTILDPKVYDWSEAGVLQRRWYGWGYYPITVVFTHGYTEAPAEVTAIVQAVAQRAVDNPSSLVRRQAGPFADTYSQTGFNQSLPIALLAAEKEALDRYKLPSRP